MKHGELDIVDRQSERRVPIAALRRIMVHVLRREWGVRSFALSIVLVDAPTVARLNEEFLGHSGATDVITFDHSEHPGTRRATLSGEVIVCADEAAAQAVGYRVSFNSELARCAIHGLLHLLGYDDHTAAQRRRMRAEEDRVLEALRKRFPAFFALRPARAGRRGG